MGTFLNIAIGRSAAASATHIAIGGLARTDTSGYFNIWLHSVPQCVRSIGPVRLEGRTVVLIGLCLLALIELRCRVAHIGPSVLCFAVHGAMAWAMSATAMTQTSLSVLYRH